MEARIARLESDVGHIREDVAAINARLDRWEGRLDELRQHFERRFERVEGRLEEMRQHFEARFDELRNRYDDLRDRMEQMDRRLASAKVWALLLFIAQAAAVYGTLARTMGWI